MVLPPVDPNQPVPEPEVVRLVDPTAKELTSLYQNGFAAADMQRFNLVSAGLLGSSAFEWKRRRRASIASVGILLKVFVKSA